LALYLRTLLSEWGFDTWIDDVGNVLAVKGRGTPVIWLHAHMDTVPGELPVIDKGDTVAGRGAVDDKGPLVSYLLAFREAEANARLVLTLVVDEEGRSRGTEHLIESRETPKPSAVLVGEPTNMHIVYAYRGGAKLVIRRGSVGGHSSSSPIYSNPIDEVLETYLDLLRLLPAGQRYEDFTVSPTIFNCGDASNKIPTSCSAVIDVRIPPGKSCNDVEQIAKALNIEVIGCVEPVQANPTNPVARALMRSLLRRGKKPLLSRKWGTSDMNLLIRLTGNIAAFGPGNPVLSHTDNEEIGVGDVVEAAQIVKSAVEELPKLLNV